MEEFMLNKMRLIYGQIHEEESPSVSIGEVNLPHSIYEFENCPIDNRLDGVIYAKRIDKKSVFVTEKGEESEEL